MQVTVEIPDDLARRLSAMGSDLSRCALKALAADEYRNGQLTKPELRRLLGFDTRYELDGFLKSHRVYDDYTPEEVEREVETLQRLGF